MTDKPEPPTQIHPYKPPPPDFDPLQASERILEELGLPPRPAASLPEALEFWNLLFSGPLRFIEAELRPLVLETMTIR
jgi:hypothetical protein